MGRTTSAAWSRLCINLLILMDIAWLVGSALYQTLQAAQKLLVADKAGAF